MMTAEQFWQSLPEETKYKWAAEVRPNWAFPLAESYAAAQLAEKEREIARLMQIAGKFDADVNKWMSRAEAAEERLKEAQAQVEHWNSVSAQFENLYEDVVSRLRQREAELEQLRAQISAERSTS